MILEEETFKQYGYYPKDLSYGSSRRILAKCDKCGKIRETCKNDYRDLCFQCAKKKQSSTLNKKEKEINRKVIDILEQETYNEFGYYPRNLKPHSGRRILVECIECGKIRKIRRSSLNNCVYQGLCNSCAQRRKIFTFEHKRKLKIAKQNISDDTKQRMKKAKQNMTIETKEKMSLSRRGELNPNWEGGIGINPYCYRFSSEFKNRVRGYWNWKCVVCNKDEEENGRRLDVHHVTYNKDTCCDDTIPLFVSLCIKCHRKIHSNEDFWLREFKRIIYSKDTSGKCYYTKEEMKNGKKK